MVSALLSRARRARGCSTPGDDRLETRAYALKRYLHRLGHAQRSARYATSIAQLVVGWPNLPAGDYRLSVTRDGQAGTYKLQITRS